MNICSKKGGIFVKRGIAHVMRDKSDLKRSKPDVKAVDLLSVAVTTRRTYLITLELCQCSFLTPVY